MMAIFVQVDIVIAPPLLRNREALVPPQWTPFPPFVVKARVTTSIQELRRPVSRRCVARLFAVPREAIS